MIGSIGSKQARRRAARWKARTAYVAVVGVIAIAACGSGKPAYCSARTNLENSVKGLTSLNSSSGISGLQSQVKKLALFHHDPSHTDEMMDRFLAESRAEAQRKGFEGEVVAAQEGHSLSP